MSSVPCARSLESPQGHQYGREGERHITHFHWSEEDYPDPDTEVAGIHGLKRVGGGMIAFEKGIARGIIWVWTIALILLIVKCILQGVCIYRNAIQC